MDIHNFPTFFCEATFFIASCTRFQVSYCFPCHKMCFLNQNIMTAK